ncbi:hypothetical protein AB1N83_007536 [Pleurotus pulmonarius]
MLMFKIEPRWSSAGRAHTCTQRAKNSFMSNLSRPQQSGALDLTSLHITPPRVVPKHFCIRELDVDNPTFDSAHIVKNSSEKSTYIINSHHAVSENIREQHPGLQHVSSQIIT